MAVYYKLYQEKREGAKYENKWYARAKITGQVTLRQLAKTIEANVSVKESDVYAVLIEMVNAMRNELLNSHSVKVDRLGIFSVGMSTAPAESAAAFTANANVRGLHINFLPEQLYLSGTGKGKRPTTTLLAGVKVRELPKNDVDTSKP
jgi:predicted histone-like DNA-binding protein